jgi:hypothetical protein
LLVERVHVLRIRRREDIERCRILDLPRKLSRRRKTENRVNAGCASNAGPMRSKTLVRFAAAPIVTSGFARDSGLQPTSAAAKPIRIEQRTRIRLTLALRYQSSFNPN